MFDLSITLAPAVSCALCRQPIVGLYEEQGLDEVCVCRACVGRYPSCVFCSVSAAQLLPLPDGREICMSCRGRGVSNPVTYTKIFDRSRAWVEQLVGWRVQSPLARLLVSGKELRAAGVSLKTEGLSGLGGERLWGLCITTQQSGGERTYTVLQEDWQSGLALASGAVHEYSHALLTDATGDPAITSVEGEGFATYLQWLWMDASVSRKRLQRWLQSLPPLYQQGFLSYRDRARHFASPRAFVRTCLRLPEDARDWRRDATVAPPVQARPNIHGHNQKKETSVMSNTPPVTANASNNALTEANFISNPVPKCGVVILCDVSGSMHGEPIAELKAGIQALLQELSADAQASCAVDLAIVTFASDVQVVRDWSTVKDMQLPELTAGGCTVLAGGVQRALDMLASRKLAYRAAGVSAYCPWIICITDGSSCGETEADIEHAATRLREAEARRQVAWFGIGVKGVDLAAFGRFAARKPMMLKGLMFRELFAWVSASLKQVSCSRPGDKVPLPPATDWAEV